MATCIIQNMDGTRLDRTIGLEWFWTVLVLKEYAYIAIYFHFGLSINTFEVTVIIVVIFLITCVVSEILKENRRQRH